MNNIIEHFLFFSDQISDKSLILNMEESHHAFLVLGIDKKSIFFVTDGNGNIYTCKIETFESKEIRAKILVKKIQNRSGPLMNFYIGLPQKDAFESILTGLTSLGVAHITPLVCDFCQKKWWATKWEKQFIRFRKKMISAAKQSWNAWIPEILHPTAFKDAIKKKSGICFVADNNGITLDNLLKDTDIQDNFSCFIGPPGGFSENELMEMKLHGFKTIKLSDHRLRTELAATVFAGNIVQRFVLNQ